MRKHNRIPTNVFVFITLSAYYIFPKIKKDSLKRKLYTVRLLLFNRTEFKREYKLDTSIKRD